mmetsp:Transcript_46789/g.146634  ORF Transcript_46789/g.146634 Transcript_46789/m.146634 type:complete len:261 (-) Transcript_46789:431-1213(-)
MIDGIDVVAARRQDRQRPRLERHGDLPGVHGHNLLRPQHHGLLVGAHQLHELEAGGVHQVRPRVLDEHGLVVQPREADLALLHAEARDGPVDDLGLQLALDAVELQGRRVVDVDALGEELRAVALGDQPDGALRHLDDVERAVADVAVDGVRQAAVLEDGVVDGVRALREQLRPRLLGDLAEGASRDPHDVVRHVLHVRRVDGLELQEAEEGIVVHVKPFLQEHWFTILDSEPQLPSADPSDGERAGLDQVLRQAQLGPP